MGRCIICIAIHGQGAFVTDHAQRCGFPHWRHRQLRGRGAHREAAVEVWTNGWTGRCGPPSARTPVALIRCTHLRRFGRQNHAQRWPQEPALLLPATASSPRKGTACVGANSAVGIEHRRAHAMAFTARHMNLSRTPCGLRNHWLPQPQRPVARFGFSAQRHPEASAPRARPM